MESSPGACSMSNDSSSTVSSPENNAIIPLNQMSTSSPSILMDSSMKQLHQQILNGIVDGSSTSGNCQGSGPGALIYPQIPRYSLSGGSSEENISFPSTVSIVESSPNVAHIHHIHSLQSYPHHSFYNSMQESLASFQPIKLETMKAALYANTSTGSLTGASSGQEALPPSPLGSGTFQLQISKQNNAENNSENYENLYMHRINVGKSSLTLPQIECVCDALLHKKDLKKLEDFLKAVPQRIHLGSEPTYRAKIHTLFHRQNFNEMYKFMENFSFSPKYHTELQELWYQAHYKEQELVRGRPLGAVDKYRIRNKFQLPKTIWDGEKTTYCFKDRARDALKSCYARCRYPTPTDKKTLSEITGLTSIQVSNWFKNKRQRDRTPILPNTQNTLAGCTSNPREDLLCGQLTFSPNQQTKAEDDFNNDIKPLTAFRTTNKNQAVNQRIKLNKHINADNTSNMLDLTTNSAIQSPVTKRNGTTVSTNPYSPTTSSVVLSRAATSLVGGTNTQHHTIIGSIHQSQQNGNSSQVISLSANSSNPSTISVIQSVGGGRQLYHHHPQVPSPYDSYIQSPHHHSYSSHGSSPHIMSYG